MKQARISISLIGTEGMMDKAEKSYNIKSLCDCLEDVKEWAKNLDKKYPNMEWTYICGDKYLEDDENIDTEKPLTNLSILDDNFNSPKN